MERRLVKLITPAAVKAEILAHGFAGARRELARPDSLFVELECDTVHDDAAIIVDELETFVVFLILEQSLHD